MHTQCPFFKVPLWRVPVYSSHVGRCGHMLWTTAGVPPSRHIVGSHNPHCSAHTQPQYCFNCLLCQSTIAGPCCSNEHPTSQYAVYMHFVGNFLGKNFIIVTIGHAHVCSYTMPYSGRGLLYSGHLWGSLKRPD